VLIAGRAAGATLGAAAALIQGVALLWRRSRPVSVLGVCVAGYAVNAQWSPGGAVCRLGGAYAAGVYGRGGRRAVYCDLPELSGQRICGLIHAADCRFQVFIAALLRGRY